MKLDNLKSIDQMVDLYPRIFTKNKLAWIVRNRDRNGFGEAVTLMAGKAYFDIEAFEQALDERNAA